MKLLCNRFVELRHDDPLKSEGRLSYIAQIFSRKSMEEENIHRVIRVVLDIFCKKYDFQASTDAVCIHLQSLRRGLIAQAVFILTTDYAYHLVLTICQ